MQYQVVKVGEFRQTPKPNSDWSPNKTQPFCMIFAITPEGNFLLTGMEKETKTYLRQRFTQFIARYTYWKNGENRGGWLSSKGIQVQKSNIPFGKNKPKTQVTIFKSPTNPVTLEFRRLPKKWLPVYNQAYTA